MSKEPSMQALHCPSCGAPFEIQSVAHTRKCKYCGTSVIIPQEHKAPPPPRINYPSPKPYLSDEKGQLALIATVILGLTLLFLSLTTGKKSQPRPSYTPYIPPPTATATLPPPSFAQRSLTFDTISSESAVYYGQAIAVDNEGNILVTDWIDALIYSFDSNGTHLETISLEEDLPGFKAMCIGKDGQIILLNGGNIETYERSGRKLSWNYDRFYTDIAVGGDGALYAATAENTIIRFGADGQLDLETDSFPENTDAEAISTLLAVDNAGNMYAVGMKNVSVHPSFMLVKYAPDGTILHTFGEEYSKIFYNQTGAVAVDEYGRIYIANMLYIRVFDANGIRLGEIYTSEGTHAWDLVIDGENNLYALTDENTIEKFQLPAR